MRLQFADKLHGANFRCAAQGSGREGIDKCPDRVCIIVQRTADAAHEVNNVTVILHLFVKVHFYVMAVAAEVIAGKVYQHHVLCIFLGIVLKVPGIYSILFRISGTFGSAGDGIYIGMAAFNAAVRFGRRAEDTEAAEIKVKQIWRWVDAAQSTVKFEVVAYETLFETAGEDYLENISPHAVGYSSADIGFVFLIGQ